MPNIELTKKHGLSSFRRIAIGTWSDAYDPSVYGSLTVGMDEAMRYVERFREVTGKRLTVTHMLAKAMGAVLHQNPEANAILRFNRIYLRKRIGIFFQVAMEDAATGEVDLSGCTIYDPEQKTLAQIVDEFEDRTRKVRRGEDEQLEGTRSTFKKIPFLLLNRFLKLISLLTYTFNLDMRWAGIPQDPFGSCMITNIGSLKLDDAYVPLVPYSKVPLLVAAGEVKEVPVVRDGQIVVGKVMKLCTTFDHRVLDGMHLAAMVKIMRRWIEEPFTHFDKLDGTSPASADPRIEAPASAGQPSI